MLELLRVEEFESVCISVQTEYHALQIKEGVHHLACSYTYRIEF